MVENGEGRSVRSLRSANGHSIAYRKLQEVRVQSFLYVLGHCYGSKWDNMLELVDNPSLVGERKVPRCFIALSGPRTQNKKLVMNKLLVDWQIETKLKKVEPDECPFYKPSTQAMNLRSFMSYMKSTYDWQIQLGDLKGFNGAVVGVIKELFAIRHKEWVRFICYSLMFSFYCILYIVW